MLVQTRKLGLAAYIKMQGGTLIKADKGNFEFESDTPLQSWEIEYSNSCCHRHDSELINLRNLL